MTRDDILYKDLDRNNFLNIISEDFSDVDLFITDNDEIKLKQEMEEEDYDV